MAIVLYRACNNNPFFNFIKIVKLDAAFQVWADTASCEYIDQSPSFTVSSGNLLDVEHDGYQVFIPVNARLSEAFRHDSRLPKFKARQRMNQRIYKS
jgi:hypothetical protein